MEENEVQDQADSQETAEEENPSEDAETVATPEESLRKPDFAPLRESKGSRTKGALNRFFDVHIPVWAELGRVEMLLGDLMKLNAGSVVRLNRPVSEPVEIVSQGVTLARGEVVVVDDCFAVRIKEIESGGPNV